MAITAAVVFANILYLLGFFDANPLDVRSGLGQVTRPGILGGLPTIDPNNGFTAQAFGHLAVHNWFHLQVPWWNPYEGTGAPLAGEMQSAALSPFTIFTGASNGQLYQHMLFELISGIATYLLLRRLAIARWVSTAAAVAFALNGTFAWFTHAPANVVPFLPLLLLGIEIAYAATVADRRRGWWLIAVAGALSVYAGFPETAYIDSLFGALWVAWRCGCAGRLYIRPFMVKIAMGTICGVLLAAPILVAFGDYEGHSLNIHTAIGNEHLPLAALPQLLLPYVYGPIFGYGEPTGTLDTIWGSVGGYLSVSLLLFGIVGLVSSGRRGLRLILASWIVLSLARIYGEPPGLGAVLGVFPGMLHIAFFRYADPALELAIIILAALGMDSVSSGTAPYRRLAVVVLVTLALVTAAAVKAHSLADKVVGASHQLYARGSVIWAVAVVVVAALAMLVPNAKVRRVLVAAIVSIEAFALFVLPEFSAPRSVTIDTAPVRFLQRHQGLSRFATLGPLEPNYGSYFGLRAVNANDALLPLRFTTYVTRHLDSAVVPLIFNGTPPGRPPGAPTSEQELLGNLAGYRAAAVRYVVVPAGTQLPGGPRFFKLVLQSPTTWIYRIVGSLPYFTSTKPSCSVRPESATAARVSCRVTTTLVRRETYMPGWSASVDGKPHPVHPHDGVFQGVTVGPGTHRVTFAFTPPHMDLALVGFAAGCLWLLAGPLLRLIRIRFRTPGPAVLDER